MKIKDFCFLIELKDFLLSESYGIDHDKNENSQFEDYADRLNEIINKLKEEE